jgi:hypothetical protein
MRRYLAGSWEARPPRGARDDLLQNGGMRKALWTAAGVIEQGPAVAGPPKHVLFFGAPNSILRRKRRHSRRHTILRRRWKCLVLPF